MKLNVLLAVTDSLRTKYKNMLSNYIKFFSKSQSPFVGQRNTYEPREGMVDDPNKRNYTRVVTTVDEKFNYFLEESKEFIDSLMSQEATNAMGLATADLIVEKDNWGTFTSLELLRLKSLLESSDLGNLEQMLNNIPVRSDSTIWNESTAEEYEGRKIFETSLNRGISKTTTKTEFVLEDPNIAKFKELPANYSPRTSVKTVPEEIGDYTSQTFSGEWSQRQKALAMKKRNLLLTATIKALKECNECEVVKSELTSEKIFGYILKD